ncbi:hypothetical protein D9753_10530 [Streptomyces dangxiongensis]|uniref:Uncharacterized protein n=1 Tax=Streptomyces dangxiongensis TaxID=1442032 RepID=A0A3G2JFJ4_9ACTN|nr:hypothetical protein D9753_10530 [Streptomyces dangxiongensis]
MRPADTPDDHRHLRESPAPLRAPFPRWCVRHRLIAVPLGLLALGGTIAGAAAAGSAYSDGYDAHRATRTPRRP